MAQHKAKWYKHVLERMKIKLKARWVILNAMRSPKAHGAVLMPKASYYFENHIRFLPEEFHYSRGFEKILGNDLISGASRWHDSTLWEPTHKFNDRTDEYGLNQPFTDQEWCFFNYEEQFLERYRENYGFQLARHDLQYNKWLDERIHGDIRQSMMY